MPPRPLVSSAPFALTFLISVAAGADEPAFTRAALRASLASRESFAALFDASTGFVLVRRGGSGRSTARRVCGDEVSREARRVRGLLREILPHVTRGDGEAGYTFVCRGVADRAGEVQCSLGVGGEYSAMYELHIAPVHDGTMRVVAFVVRPSSYYAPRDRRWVERSLERLRAVPCSPG